MKINKKTWKSLDLPADAIEVRSNIWFDIFIFFFLVFSDGFFSYKSLKILQNFKNAENRVSSSRKIR